MSSTLSTMTTSLVGNAGTPGPPGPPGTPDVADACAAPAQVLCVVDDEHRELDVARQVVDGTITVAGRTIHVGTSPDWSSDPCPLDREWRVDWVKFYYGLDLAHAYGVSGDDRYVRGWEALLVSYVAQREPGADKAEVVARRIQNWIYAWNRFQRHGAGLSPSAATVVQDFLWREVAHVRDHLSAGRNHRTLELYALLVAAMAFPERDPQRELRTFAFDALCTNLLADVRADGVHREASTHYHCIALRSWLGAYALARECGVSLGTPYRDRLQAACEFAAHVHRPDGRIPACSDGDCESYLDVVALAAELFQRPDWMWIATRGRAGDEPRATHMTFPDAGYHIQRSGWRAADAPRYLLFDCGPLGDGGHGHYDALSVEVFGAGRPLVVDPGRYTYSEAGDCNWRHWFKGTAAHNTVTVDGLDQTAYARRTPKGAVAHAQLLHRASAPGFDVIAGEVRTGCYDAVHTRTVMFVAGEYWVIVDHLAAPSPHLYELRWHLSPEASVALALEDGGSRVRARGVTLAVTQGRPLRIDSGWYAPQYGVKQPAAIVTAAVHAYTTMFVTVIEPQRRLDASRAIRVGVVSRGDGPSDRSVVDVCGVGVDGDGIDRLTWSTSPHFMEAAGFRGTARAAWVRCDARRRASCVAAVDVVNGTWRDRTGCETLTGATAGTWIVWERPAGHESQTRDTATSLRVGVSGVPGERSR